MPYKHFPIHPIFGIVYRVVNRLTGCVYIGITSRRLSDRIKSHIRQSTFLGRAIRKYGVENFQVRVIDTAITWEWLCKKEKQYISFYKSKGLGGYNLTDGGDGVIGRKHDRDTRRRISESVKLYRASLSPKQKELRRIKVTGMKRLPEVGEKISRALKGRHHTKTHRANLSKSYSYDKHFTPQIRKKLSEGAYRFWDRRKRASN